MNFISKPTCHPIRRDCIFADGVSKNIENVSGDFGDAVYFDFDFNSVEVMGRKQDHMLRWGGNNYAHIYDAEYIFQGEDGSIEVLSH